MPGPTGRGYSFSLSAIGKHWRVLFCCLQGYLVANVFVVQAKAVVKKVEAKVKKATTVCFPSHLPTLYQKHAADHVLEEAQGEDRHQVKPLCKSKSHVSVVIRCGQGTSRRITSLLVRAPSCLFWSLRGWYACVGLFGKPLFSSNICASVVVAVVVNGVSGCMGCFYSFCVWVLGSAKHILYRNRMP